MTFRRHSKSTVTSCSMTSNIRLLSISTETKMYEPSSSIHGSKQKVRCKPSLVHLVEFYLLFSRFHDCFKCEKPSTRGMWLTRTKYRCRMRCTNAYVQSKSKATKLMLHEIQLLLSPGLYSSMDKCFLHCSELLSQMIVEKERPGILCPNAGPCTVTAPIRTC